MHEVAEATSGRFLVFLSDAKSQLTSGSPISLDVVKAASQACEYQAIRVERSPVPLIFLRAYKMHISRRLPLRLVPGVIKGFVERKPTSSDFWEMAKESEKKLQDYVHDLLEAAAAYFKSTKFTDIGSTMNHIVNTTATFRDDIKGALDARNITLDAFTKELEGVFMAIVNDLEQIPHPDKAPGRAERADMVERVLDNTTEALVKLATCYGIEEEVVTTYLTALKPQVQALIVIIGDINEQHPKLFPALTFSVAVLLIPESWMLKPFLSVFGFGPAGPVEGSVAAWLQRRFWGAAVEAGSWFSWLQAAGMGVLPQWAGPVAKTPFLIGSILAMLRSRLSRE
ncbi:hypothetical protein JVT61DRAFT_3470 [Boletus reticuloceps]|uniref:Uncharacterized protein n=1 Tax=Boletus reticuloceps TaxID=495285 RepID=A0A8I2YNI8_9AGAM|nr:hypothetical protein JVT61DRAFT_3470 [Boletus reticuloceps]